MGTALPAGSESSVGRYEPESVCCIGIAPGGRRDVEGQVVEGQVVEGEVVEGQAVEG
jgi:hypothetical protein